jgi:hypothetical protein
MRLAILTIMLAAAPAAAGHRVCHEDSAVVGYQRCSRFGTEWSGATLSWELGSAWLRFPLDAIDRMTSTGHVVAPASTGTATALRLRDLYGFTEHFYVASELTFGWMTTMPLLDVAPTRGAMPTGDGTNGYLGAGMLAAGLRSSLGPITLGSELAFGARLAVFSSDRVPGVLFGQGGPILEARAHANVWLSMHWSLSTMLATSVVERGDTSITVSLGLHAFPFDGGR